MSENTKVCPKCRTEIDKKATVCPNCKSKLGPSKLLVAILLFVGLSVIMALFGEDPSTTSWNPSDLDICIYSQMRIEEQLKAPSTAKHPACSLWQLTNSGSMYTFASYVDAQNSFGAMIRTNYKCSLNIMWEEYTIKCETY